MNRIDSRTVEFTHSGEVAAKERFEQALDDGLTITAAAIVALEDQTPAARSRLSRDFVEYLSDGCVMVIKKTGRVMSTPKGRQYP